MATGLLNCKQGGSNLGILKRQVPTQAKFLTLFPLLNCIRVNYNKRKFLHSVCITSSKAKEREEDNIKNAAPDTHLPSAWDLVLGPEAGKGSYRGKRADVDVTWGSKHKDQHSQKSPTAQREKRDP